MPEIYKLKFTKQSNNQIVEIFDYISYNLNSPQTAARLLREIKDKTLKLADFPEMYELVEFDPWRTYGIRKITVANFVIYYWPDHENKMVLITSVVYGKRNQLFALKQMILEDK